MKSISFFILFIFWFNASFGQVTIEGLIKSTITDSVTISTSYVEITNIDKPILERMTMTDSLGSFRLEGLKQNMVYQLKVSAYGYDDQVFEVKTDDNLTSTTFNLKGNCYYNEEKADKDWRDGKAKLLLFGSIAPIANSSADRKFERKFGLEYYDFGDSPPIQECLKIYNERIFKHMDQKYGDRWRKKVRTDVEFLK